MAELSLVADSPEATEAIAARIGARLQAKDAVALVGPLGAGKTVFARGLARGLGVDPAAPVTSPTYVILHERLGPVPLYHFDFYRLEAEREVIDLGFDEYLDGDGVTVVEWADKFPGLFNARTLWVRLEPLDEQRRRITFAAPDGFDDRRRQELWRAVAGASGPSR